MNQPIPSLASFHSKKHECSRKPSDRNSNSQCWWIMTTECCATVSYIIVYCTLPGWPCTVIDQRIRMPRINHSAHGNFQLAGELISGVGISISLRIYGRRACHSNIHASAVELKIKAGVSWVTGVEFVHGSRYSHWNIFGPITRCRIRIQDRRYPRPPDGTWDVVRRFIGLIQIQLEVLGSCMFRSSPKNPG